MTRLLPIILFFACLMPVAELSAQNSKPYIYIECGNGLQKKIHSYKKINFIDSQGQVQKGKIYIYNDSQFCFINYFNEVSSDTIHINQINQIYLKANNNYALPVLAAIGLLTVPYITIPVLIVRYFVNRNRPHSAKASTGWYSKDEFTVSVKGIYETA